VLGIEQKMKKDLTNIWRNLLEKTIRDNKTGCLLWTGKVHHAHKEARIILNGKSIQVARISLKLKLRDEFILSDRAQIVRTCNNKLCIEPSHIRKYVDIDPETVREMYIDQQLSCKEIAEKLKCKTNRIYKIMVRFKIPRRTRSETHNIQISKGKRITFRNGKFVIHEKRYSNWEFFKVWTPEMAYTLGFILTDGSLREGKDGRRNRLSISQKQPEILKKILFLAASNAKILKESRSKGCYYIDLPCNEDMWNDLLTLGLHPNKTFTAVCPKNIPQDCESHLVRGCWDGDGCISVEKPTKKNRFSLPFPRAILTGAAKDLIIGIENIINKNGLEKHRLTQQLNKYNLKYSGIDCYHLYKFMYFYKDGSKVPESMYLNRKHNKFFQSTNRYQ